MFERWRVKWRAKVISRDLRAVLAAVSRPTEAEIKADKYEESEPVRQWLDRGAMRRFR